MEDLKASSNCNSSYPEPPAATHKTGLSLAVLFWTSCSLGLWQQVLQTSLCTSSAFPSLCRGVWGWKGALSAGLRETSALCRASAGEPEWWKAFWVHLNGVSMRAAFLLLLGWCSATPGMSFRMSQYTTWQGFSCAAVPVGDLTESASELFSPEVIPCLAFIYWW